MDPRDLYSKAMTAAYVAQAHGYEGLSKAFKALAVGIQLEISDEPRYSKREGRDAETPSPASAAFADH